MTNTIIRSDGRIYLNLTKSGCGIGCNYCFVKKHNEHPIFFNYDVIEKDLNNCLNLNFISGKNGNVFVLSPESEPFVNAMSTCYIDRLLRILLPLGNPIQISTKSKIPDSIINTILACRCYLNQIVFYISIPLISKSQLIEFHSDDVTIRFENMKQLKKFNILSCLYIKPFLNHTFKDISLFIKNALIYSPEYICIGANYEKRIKKYTHPLHANYYSSGITNKMKQFSKEIFFNTGIKSFFNASCVIAHANETIPTSKIWSVFSHLCIDCMDCKLLFNSVSEEKRTNFYGE
jgi:hypothetical protein